MTPEHPLVTAARRAAIARAAALTPAQIWRLGRALDRLQATPPATLDRLLRGEDAGS